MRTKLILLLIFSSLTSLTYSQSLTIKEMQGLWYMIDNETQKFDSLYALRYDSIIFVDNWRTEVTELSTKAEVKHKLPSSETGVPNSLLEEITVLTGGFGAKYGGYEPLEVFEIKNNKAKFFTNLYTSGLVFNDEDYDELRVKYGKKFIEYMDYSPIEIEFRIEQNELLFEKYQTRSWTSNEILFYNNDTMIVRSPERNDYNVYIRKQIDTNINYKVKEIVIHESFCLGSCPKFTTQITPSGKFYFKYKNSGWYRFKKPEINNGTYSFELNKKDIEDLLYLLKYKNLKSGEKIFGIAMSDATPYKMYFILESGEKIEYEFYYCNGPPELRIIYYNIRQYMVKMAAEK